jgi:hypothetical protein
MSIASENLILLSADRKKRQLEKQHAVLRFLRQHLWSSQDILQDVMHLQSRQAAHKTLSQMQSEGLVRSHQYLALGGKLTLWGITAHGQAMSFDPNTEQLYGAYFEPSRISEQNIRHQLDLQKLRVNAELRCWHSWTDGDRLGGLDKEAKRPDAIAKNAQGQVVAIECERTFKTIKRYEQILVSYLKLLRAGRIAKVVWVLPTQDMADRLHLLITSIKSVKVAGQAVQIDPTKHHVNIHFCSYQNWPSYE